MCLSNWLLGVGDRHLENILISKRTGEAVGIDFGQIFGSSVFLSNTPELVPFRLTNLILNLMNPLKELGYIKQSMVHSLRALGKNQESILATLSIFAMEPLKTKFPDSQTPEVLVSRTRRKLQGENPCHIFSEKLSVTFEIKKISKEMADMLAEFVRGDENNRSNLNQRDLSVEEQVNCLIEQATDTNLLGRMYPGWQPWF